MEFVNPNKSWAQHHCNLKLSSNLKYPNLFLNINSSASCIKLCEKRFDIKLLLLFNQYKIASNPRSMGIDKYKLSMSHEYKAGS